METLSYFDHMSSCHDFDLENSKPIFLHALQLIMMCHNTKFGNKMFGGLEDIIGTNTDIPTLHYDLDLECINPIFPQDISVYDAVLSYQTTFGCKPTSSLEGTTETVIF